MPQKYDSIIFDLGGVLYDIDVQRTKNAFAALGLNDFSKLYTLKEQVDLFDSLEKGFINEEGFVEGINKLSGIPFTPAQVKQAWNALLIGMPAENVGLLRNLKADGYNLYLLSNTNILHYSSIQSEMQQKFGLDSLDELFDKAYISYKIGMRKPDAEIYEHVMKDIDPERSIFIDDNEDNVKASIAAGISAVQKLKNETLQEVLERWVL
jgi:FMN phosphatase YigB (HAD superfamily)